MSFPPNAVSEAYRATVTYVEQIAQDRPEQDLRQVLAGDRHYRALLTRLQEETGAALDRAHNVPRNGNRWMALGAMEPLFLPARDTVLAPLGFARTRSRAAAELALLGAQVGLTREDVTTVLEDAGATWPSVRRWIVGRILTSTEDAVRFGTSAPVRQPLQPYRSGLRGRRPVELVYLPSNEPLSVNGPADDEAPAVRVPAREPETQTAALRRAYQSAVDHVERHSAGRSPEELRSFLAGDRTYADLLADLIRLAEYAETRARLAQSQSGRWGAVSAMEPMFLLARDTTLAPHGFAEVRDRAAGRFRRLALKIGVPYGDALAMLDDPQATWGDVHGWILNRIDLAPDPPAGSGYSTGRGSGAHPSYRPSKPGWRPVEIVPLDGDDVPASYRSRAGRAWVPWERPAERPRRQGHVPPAP